MTRKIRILSLDGGGIRGIIPGTILNHIERALQAGSGGDCRLADCFDLIAGTSTGGILACGYLLPDAFGSRPRYTAEEVLDVYRKHGGEIFPDSRLNGLRSLIGEKYQADALEENLLRFFGDATLAELLKPCLIPAYDIRNRKTKFFNSVDGARRTRNFAVRDVARATSAAPTYFEASMIRSKFDVPHALIDGGVVANNPALCAYSEARTLDFGDLLGDRDAPNRPSAKDMMIVSIGTGKETRAYRWAEAKDWGKAGWLQPVLDIMMSGASEIVDFQLRRMFDTLDPWLDRNYTRLEPELHDASSQMDDASDRNIRELEVAGRRFIEANEQQLQTLVDDLIAAGPPAAKPRPTASSPGRMEHRAAA
jgi:patatin-like phospholipase/acyl hydrolase